MKTKQLDLKPQDMPLNSQVQSRNYKRTSYQPQIVTRLRGGLPNQTFEKKTGITSIVT